MSVFSIYVEKKPSYAVEAAAVLSDLREALGISELKGVRICNRYFLEHLDPQDFAMAVKGILSEPQVDIVWDTLPQAPHCRVFGVEFLPSQFDQRADSCAQCISLATGKNRPTVRSARVYILEGDISDESLAAIKRYLINPVESREASLEVPDTLMTVYPVPARVKTLDGFIHLDTEGLEALRKELGLAMDQADMAFCQFYFHNEEKRDPTITELRMIDTYWSDHCRHTTFLTQIQTVDIQPEYIKRSYKRYTKLRMVNQREKPVTLMDLATIGAKEMKRQGLLNRLDESEEINACSVSVRILVDNKPQDWLLMFKNETHNHPTEIEPFGGAATCLGGAIRDPLSGRSYVYQAMRLTGAGNPLQSAADTLPGKLPQRKITQTAAAGYSSYGNQIGLATGLVHEIYHPGYVAKRMEVGAVLGAAPQSHVRREVPAKGDVVILLGGRTGRDGCGGATGSSKSHTAASLENCGAEVQKGNAPEERKLQRLLRNPTATTLIKRCNDFGAGGISVAIGELADGLRINLDAVPKKYEGLDGTELAISESQERMAVVVSAKDVETFIALADQENLEATPVAEVTQDNRLTMEWSGQQIVSLSRKFLNSNGAHKTTTVAIATPELKKSQNTPITGETLYEMMTSLAFCSQKGLGERFDSTIGAGTVLLPYGGKYQATPAQVMAAKLPVPEGETDTCSLMSWGYDPERSSQSPYHGAMDAVVHSVAKIIAAGGSRKKCWLTFQEYFERLGDDPYRWGKPMAALLGALDAQLELQVAAIGGKDSMSGSFEELDVPPTLISFAVSTASVTNIIPNEFQQPGSYVYLFEAGRTDEDLLDFDDTRIIFDLVEQFIEEGNILSAYAVGAGGTAEAVTKMCFGNRIGFGAYKEITAAPRYGSFVLEATKPMIQLEDFLLGRTIPEYVLSLQTEDVDLAVIQQGWEGVLEPVFPRNIPQQGPVQTFSYDAKERVTPAVRIAKPTVLIPVFPGTNCEYDTARAFEKAGAKAEIFVVRNLTASAVAQSVDAFAQKITKAQIISLPGGFSGGDEPDGSAKFITSFLRSSKVFEALTQLLQQRDGLMCGICNGFQALIKLGLVPFGEIRQPEANAPTLTFNAVGRHQSGMVRTRICSNKSPWLMHMAVGEVFTVPVSHGEGRFICEEELLLQLADNGQIATQYVDLAGKPTQDIRFNPNNSAYAVEGITSPDGRVFGKMAHSERYSQNVYRNMADVTLMNMFSGAVDYFG